ncbi:MAG: hypothetical protein K6G62_01930 [Eubacterium sp.]|nr:hypothetical protein [Eubacterium sp.]
MKKNSMGKLYAGLLLCMACAGLTACGSSSDQKSGETASGRLTSMTDTQIEIEVGIGDAVSGGAVSGGAMGQKPSGEKPSGDKPSGQTDGQAPSGQTDGQAPSGQADGQAPSGQTDGQAPSGEKPSGEKPSGEKPSGDKPSGGEMGNNDFSSQNDQGSKTYEIDEDTKIYLQEGDSKTEITADDVEIGSMVTVELDSDGDEVEAIIVQSSN